MNRPTTHAAIEMTAAQIRAGNIIANRRALAALLHHHGDRPPETDCSAEALRIRERLGQCVRVRAHTPRSPAPASEPTELSSIDPFLANPDLGVALDGLVAAVAEQRDVPVALLLAPPRRAPQASVERRAQLASREAMYRAYHELCPHFRALGRHFGKDHSAIRKAAALHAARIASEQGRG